MMLLVTTLMVMLITSILTYMFTSMKEKDKKLKEEKESFECGFDNMMTKKTPFSTSFFMLLIMFLVFDVEVSFLIPIMMMKYSHNTMSTIIYLFLIILIILLMKEWKTGMLEWKK